MEVEACAEFKNFSFVYYEFHLFKNHFTEKSHNLSNMWHFLKR